MRNGLPNTPLFGCCLVKPHFFFWLVLRATTPFSFFTERALNMMAWFKLGTLPIQVYRRHYPVMAMTSLFQ
jgi:hypothetical protein